MALTVHFGLGVDTSVSRLELALVPYWGGYALNSDVKESRATSLAGRAIDRTHKTVASAAIVLTATEYMRA